MSSLFEDISKITHKKALPEDYEDAYILPKNNIYGQLETVRLNESNRILKYPNPSMYSLAKSVMKLSGLNEGDPENEPVTAIKESIVNFSKSKHLQESWKVMGQFVERIHALHGVDLKEMVGGYTDRQLELLEMTLRLPWKLKYPTEYLEVEVDDYPISQDHVFKGTPEGLSENLSVKDRLKRKLQESKKVDYNQLVESYIEKNGSAEEAFKKFVDKLAHSEYKTTIQLLRK